MTRAQTPIQKGYAPPLEGYRPRRHDCAEVAVPAPDRQAWEEGGAARVGYSHRVIPVDSPPASPVHYMAATGGVPEQLPGQLAFPGLEPGQPDGPGQGVLPGFEEPPRPACATKAGADPELNQVAVALRATDPDGAGLAAAIRDAFDLLLDGQHTGRYRWDQLHKTEKTHAGTLIEIGIQRRLGLADGTTLDYSVAGAEVDCKFSHRSGGWMIPPEAEGRLLLLVQASDEAGTWSAGLIRAREEYLRQAGNRDLKRTLNDSGRGAIEWLSLDASLPENALLRLPERDVTAIFGWPRGQQRVNELFRRAIGRPISRAVVATVARQDDPMKRVRENGGARDQLRGEGIVIFGDYAAHQALACALGLPSPGPGEFVSARLAPRAQAHGTARYIRLDGADWVVASASEPAGPAPRLPRV